MRLFTVHAPRPPAPPPTRPGPADAFAGGYAPLLPRGSVPATAPASKPGPVALVPEGFCWAAAVLPPLWLLWHRQWLALVLFLAVSALLGALLPEAFQGGFWLALHFLMGCHAQDIRRWTARRQGLAEIAVVAAADEEAALLRLFAERPDLARGIVA